VPGITRWLALVPHLFEILTIIVTLLLTFGMPFLILFGLRWIRPRRALAVAVGFVVLSSVALVFSFPMWEVLVTGRNSEGKLVDFGDTFPSLFIALWESLTLGASLLAAARQFRQVGAKVGHSVQE